MRYAAAYLLAILGGNPTPDVTAIGKILSSVGIECDEKRAQQIVDACKGRDADEIIAEGMKKINDVSSVTIPVVPLLEPPPGNKAISPPSTPDCDCNGDCTWSLGFGIFE